MGCNASRAAISVETIQPGLQEEGRRQNGQQAEESAPTNNQPGTIGNTTLAAPHDRLAFRNMHDEFLDSGDLNGSVVRLEDALGTPIEEVYDGVRDGEKLGDGAFGIVRKVTHRSTGVPYAVKCIKLSQFRSRAAYQQLRDEIWVMCQLDHPSIVGITEACETTDEIFIVQELCQGGDLFELAEKRLDDAWLKGQTGLHFSEAQCADYIKQMLAATQYLHSKGIVHRDLKLEHWMFSSPKSKDLKMIDFGFAKHLDASGFVCGPAGTTYTKAPEVFRGEPYNEKCDVWSIGVLAYLLLAGDTPFGSLDDRDSCKSLNFKREICHGRLVFEPAEKWDLVSDTGKHFIQRLLNLNADRRPSASEALEDPWFEECSMQEPDQTPPLSSETLMSLIRFNESLEMQQLMSEVLSYTLLPEQISRLQCEFARIDKSGRGVITLQELKSVLLQEAKDSVWFLTEENVEQIFDSIRMSKTQTTIRWREFLAAGMSMAQYDERNTRLAFERLDSEHHGFLTFSDIAQVFQNCNCRESIECVWRRGVEELNLSSDRITYDDFVKLIKGRMEPLVLEPIGGSAPLAMIREDDSEDESQGASEPHHVEEKRAGRGANESGPLPAHNGDVYDGLLNDITNSPLIAKRSLLRSNRQLFVPTLADAMEDNWNDTRTGRRKAISCPANKAGLLVRRGEDGPEARRYFSTRAEQIRLAPNERLCSSRRKGFSA